MLQFQRTTGIQDQMLDGLLPKVTAYASRYAPANPVAGHQKHSRHASD